MFRSGLAPKVNTPPPDFGGGDVHSMKGLETRAPHHELDHRPAQHRLATRAAMATQHDRYITPRSDDNSRVLVLFVKSGFPTLQFREHLGCHLGFEPDVADTFRSPALAHCQQLVRLEEIVLRVGLDTPVHESRGASLLVGLTQAGHIEIDLAGFVDIAGLDRPTWPVEYLALRTCTASLPGQYTVAPAVTDDSSYSTHDVGTQVHLRVEFPALVPHVDFKQEETNLAGIAPLVPLDHEGRLHLELRGQGTLQPVLEEPRLLHLL